MPAFVDSALRVSQWRNQGHRSGWLGQEISFVQRGISYVAWVAPTCSEFSYRIQPVPASFHRRIHLCERLSWHLNRERGLHFACQTCAIQEGGAIPAGPWTRNQKQSFGVSRHPFENLQGFGLRAFEQLGLPRTLVTIWCRAGPMLRLDCRDEKRKGTDKR